MTSLTDAEREWVAIGAAIGAGCQPCTEYHMRAAIKLDLDPAEILRATSEAHDVRLQGGEAVVAVAHRVLRSNAQESTKDCAQLDLRQTLVGIGAAAGCNAGGLVERYLATAAALGLSQGMLGESIEIAELVKNRAADFLRRDVARALGESAIVAASSADSTASCCGG